MRRCLDAGAPSARHRRSRFSGLGLFFLPLLAACTGPPQAAAPLSATGVTIADLSGVNELVAADVTFTTDIHDQLFLQLLSERADFTEHPPTFAPELASSERKSAGAR